MPAKKAKAAEPASSFSWGDAPVIVAAATSKKGGNPSRDMANIADYVTVRQFEAVATTARLEIERDLKAAGQVLFIADGVSQGKRPDNFVGTEGDSKANFVYRRRDSRSHVTIDQLELFTAAFGDEWVAKNIEQVVTPTIFSINPKYMADPAWRERLQTALNTIPDLPSDIIEQTPGTTTRLVSDATFDGIFTDRDPERARQFLPLVSSIGLKVTTGTTVNLPALFAKVTTIMNKASMAEALAAAANDPDSALTDDARDGKTKAKRK